jgi:hypothetical protein
VKVMRTGGLLVLAAATALLVAGGAPAANPELHGTVGPDFDIQLNHPDGSKVTQLDPGTFDIVVTDLATEHNFHLTGPGVNRTTGVESTGTVTWTVPLVEGRYRFVCDPHNTTLRGSFVVGNPPPEPPPPPPPPPSPVTVKKLLLTVGPTAKITLLSATGKRLAGLKAGLYDIKVQDRSTVHNAHLVGARVNRKTGLAARVTVTWRVRLRAGLLRFYSDKAPTKVKGSIRVT